ncbi:hypothetical protein ACVDG5_015300 [Mesorhizobium sp. ORM6]
MDVGATVIADGLKGPRLEFDAADRDGAYGCMEDRGDRHGIDG